MNTNHINFDTTNAYQAPMTESCDSYKFINKQLQLTSDMINNTTNMKVAHAAVIQKLKDANELTANLIAEERHLRQVIEFNDQMYDSLTKQVLYINNPLSVKLESDAPIFCDKPSKLPDNLYMDQSKLDNIRIPDLIDPSMMVRCPSFTDLLVNPGVSSPTRNLIQDSMFLESYNNINPAKHQKL